MNKLLLTLLCTIIVSIAFTQKKKLSDESPINSSLVSALNFRMVGPALTSGRISDIAIHPSNQNTWYVSAASGGVWKTQNAGTTWNPIFGQRQKSEFIQFRNVSKKQAQLF